MYYESREEKRGRGFLVFLAMIIIIVLLVGLNLRLEGMQNLNNQKYSTEKLNNEEKEEEQIQVKQDYTFIKDASKTIVGISKFKSTDILKRRQWSSIRKWRVSN